MPTKQYAAKVSIGGTISSSFKRAFGGATDAVRGLGKEVKNLSRQRADIKAFTDSSRKLDDFRKKLADAKIEAKKAADALAAAEKPTSKLTRSADAAARKVKSLETSIEGQVGALSKLTLKLNQAGLKTSDLANHDAKLERRIKSVTAAMRRQEAAQAKLSAARSNFGTWMGRGLAVGAAVASFAPAINASNEFADVMVDIGKYVDGANTPEALKSIGDEIREIGRMSPIGAKGLSELVIGAGKLGMKAPEAMEFARAMETMAAGLDMLPSEAAEILTKIKSSMRQTIPEAVKLGDAMNFLGDVTASDSRNIADIMSRVGSTVKSDSNASLTDAEIAAIAAQFDIAAPNAESAATAYKNFTKALTKGEAVSKGNLWAYTQLGLEPKSMAKKMTVNAKEAIALVLEKLGKLAPDKRAGVMTKLFGEESKGVINNVIAAQDDLKKSLAAVANESNFLGRSAQEQERNFAKWSTQSGILRSQIFELGISIGDAVKESLAPLLMKVNPLLEKFALWRKENPKLFKTIVVGVAAVVALAGAIVALGIAASGLSMGFAFLGTMISGIGLVITSGAIGPILAAVAVYGAAALAIRKYWEPLKAFFHGVWLGIKEGWESAGGPAVWKTISDAFTQAGGALKEFLAPVSLTLEEFLKIEEGGKSVGKVIGETLVGFLKGAIDAFNWLGEACAGIVGIFNEMKPIFFEVGKSIRDALEPVFKWLQDTINDVANALEKLNFGSKLTDIGKSIKDTVKGGAGGFTNFAEKWGEDSFNNRNQGKLMPPAKAFPRPAIKGTQSGHIFNIHTQPGQSPEAISEEVIRKLQRRQDQMNRGSLWDGDEFATV